jgi:MscS family membrane protein
MEKIKFFWSIVIDVWEKGVWGVDIGRIVIAVFIFFAFILLRRLFTKFTMGRLKALAIRTKTQIDDNVLNALENPIRFIPIILGIFFSAEYLSLTGQFGLIATNIVKSMIAFLFFWAIINLVDPMSFLLGRLEQIFTSSMVDWLIKAVKIAFIFIGAASILEIWGIKIGPIIAGLGLFGVAVALGAQDLFKNLISGILIIAEKRFAPGNWIRVDGVVEGTVENIGFRSTLVRRFDKAPVFVPNSKLSDQAVTNFSSMTFRRISWMIGVEYRTTIAQLREIRDAIEGYILSTEDFAHPPVVPTFVRIDRFSDSSIDIMVYCFSKTTQWGEWLKIKEALAYKIKEIVEGSGTGFAFPSQSLYIEAVPGDHAEVFIPPAESNTNNTTSSKIHTSQNHKENNS